MDALIVMENSDSERLNNIIVYVFDTVLEVSQVFPPHDLSQLEPKILLKVVSTLRSSGRIYCSIDRIHIVPSPELFHGHTFLQTKSPMMMTAYTPPEPAHISLALILSEYNLFT